MDTRVFCAYNEESKRVISPRLTVVDAAREPMKVLKVLTEGLAPNARGGIWLVNFTGLPVARSYSAFDLVYLDQEHRIVHAVEISQRSEFAPFKGQPASALILPVTTLARSKTFSGDRLTISIAEYRSADEKAEAKPSKRATQLPRKASAFGAKTFNVPSEGSLDARAAAGAVSGRLMRSGSLALNSAPLLKPAVSSAIPQMVPQTVGITESEEKPEAKVVPISTAREQLPEAEVTETPDVPVQAELVTVAPVPTSVEVAPAAEHTLVAHSYPSATMVAPEATEPPLTAEAPSAEVAIVPAETESVVNPQPLDQPVYSNWKPQSSASGRQTWDVQLLYSLFPELDPAFRPEFQTPVVNFLKETQRQAIERISKKVQLLSWFYPDLELETVQKRQRQRRRAPRIPEPGLVGYYFAGGLSKPHEIRNLSVMGFYMVTDQRWMPGTVIRVTLQIKDSTGEDPFDTVTVLSRVVNWGKDGGGFEFVLPGFID